MPRDHRAIGAPWMKRLGRVARRARAIDVGLAVAVAGAVTIAISVSSYTDPNTRPPDTLAYALGVTIGALVLARRRWPVGVLVASVAMLQVYHFAHYPGISAAVPLAVALYTAAASGRLRWSLLVATWYLAGLFLYAVLWYPGLPGLILNELVRDAALLAAVLLFGDAVRSHRALMAEAAERVRRAEEERQREAQELSAARVIQQQLLPKELPSLPGWRVAAYYQPARAVGGDFYDVLALPDGQVALVAGDVTGKGIPAALVMATTYSILRSAAEELVAPGAVLERANDRLYPDIPAPMFVTCLYAVLDPLSGRLRYANAGHSLPYVTTAGGASQLRAAGMPLGALPGMTYEEHETCLAPGDSILLYSDGLIEARNAAGEMFGVRRLQTIIEQHSGSERLIDACLAELRSFAGRDWEQEDDITMVLLERESEARDQGSGIRISGAESLQVAAAAPERTKAGEEPSPAQVERAVPAIRATDPRSPPPGPWRLLAEFAIPSEPGNERLAIREVAGAVEGIGLSQRSLDRLKTAVAEATINAMEHGNKYRKDVPVLIRVSVSEQALLVAVTDRGSGPLSPDYETPDLAAKLERRQMPRGWGLFLMKSMVDEVQITGDQDHHTVGLILRLDDQPGGQ